MLTVSSRLTVSSETHDISVTETYMLQLFCSVLNIEWHCIFFDKSYGHTRHWIYLSLKTEHSGQVVSIPVPYLGGLCSHLNPETGYPDQCFCGSTQSLHAHGTLLGHDHFLSHYMQFITHHIIQCYIV